MGKRKRYSFDPPSLQTGRRGNDDFRNVWGSKLWGRIDKDDYYRMVGGVMRWDADMSRRTYRIELKIDFADDSNHEHMMAIAKQYARDLLGSAMLLQDKTKPAVVLMGEDSFHNFDEVELLEESATLHT